MRRDIFSSSTDSSNTPRMLCKFLVSVCPEEYSHIKHCQKLSRLPRPSDVHGPHIGKSDDSDKACAKIGRKVTHQSQQACPTMRVGLPAPMPRSSGAASTSCHR